jgi:hypothetical protein
MFKKGSHLAACRLKVIQLAEILAINVSVHISDGDLT